MLVPRRVKYRKQHRGSRKGVASRGIELTYGEFGLRSEDRGWVTSRQIESARRAITHHTQRGGRVWITLFPDKPISKKPPEVRMGGGKGDVAEYVAVVKPGRIMFEIGGVPQAIAVEALRLAMHKLPVKSKIMSRKGVV
jgi:large subunit ribosomal protein L16